MWWSETDVLIDVLNAVTVPRDPIVAEDQILLTTVICNRLTRSLDQASERVCLALRGKEISWSIHWKSSTGWFWGSVGARSQLFGGQARDRVASIH